MKVFDDVASVLFVIIMSHGTSNSAILKLQKAFDQLEAWLNESSTPFFLSNNNYSMVDIYGFPHTSRVFYLKGSVQNDLYEKMQIEQRYPFLYKWFVTMRSDPSLNDGRAIINVRAFHLWLEELVTLPIGKKPPLRLPMKL